MVQPGACTRYEAEDCLLGDRPRTEYGVHRSSINARTVQGTAQVSGPMHSRYDGNPRRVESAGPARTATRRPTAPRYGTPGRGPEGSHLGRRHGLPEGLLSGGFTSQVSHDPGQFTWWWCRCRRRARRPCQNRRTRRPPSCRRPSQKGSDPKWGRKLPPPRRGGQWRVPWQEGEAFVYGRMRKGRWKEVLCLWRVSGHDVVVKARWRRWRATASGSPW